MTAKREWNRLVRDFVRLSGEQDQIQEFSILGVTFHVMPGVFSPAISTDTRWFAEQLIPRVHGQSFLEVGAGSGAISCLASHYGARTVVATDINKQAVKNIEQNARAHNFPVSVRSGSMFEPIGENERFDLIFWNHPFAYAEDESLVEAPIGASVFDFKYQGLKEYFTNAHLHLVDGGELLLGTSNVARIRLVKQLARKAGYKIKLVSKKEVEIHQYNSKVMDLRMYQFLRS